MKSKFKPIVSIIIPVYNGSNYLREAIDSAVAQTYRRIEILVINDGSNDAGKTEEIAKSYGKKIRYFSKENGGVASALNYGIANMKGEYFSWLSHDDIYFSDKIEKQIVHLAKLKNKDTIIYGDVEYIDADSKILFRTNYAKLHSLKQLNSGLFPVLKGYANGCMLLIPKKVILDVGGFNEKLKTSNDYDMWFRIFGKNETNYIPEVLIQYRLHEKQGTRTIPSYHKEADTLWSTVILSLKEKEIEGFDYSFFSFFYKLANQMKASSYDKAFKIAYNRAYKYFKKGAPLLSVVMPCRNSEEYIHEAMDSLFKQTFCDFELILVDDHSTNNTWRILNKYKKKDYRIRIIKNNNKQGVSGAMNSGLKNARGIYITRMDDDDISLPERFEKQFNFLEKNHIYGLCSVNMSAFGDISVPFLYNKRELPLEWLFLFMNPIACAPTMYRREILIKNKMKYRNFKVAGDYDFFSQMVCYAKPYMLEEVLYQYRIHSSSIFQRNRSEALTNSIKINMKLVKKIYKGDIPYFHKYLTDFASFSDDNIEPDLYKILEWIRELLKHAKKYWKWNRDEYNKVFIDTNRMILDILKRPMIRVEEEVNRLNSINEKFRIDSNKLVEENSLLSQNIMEIERSASWRITRPFRSTKRISIMVKKDGVVKTTKYIFQKIRKIIT